MAQNQERNQEATVYVGNLDEKVTDTLLWELMLQAGPVGKNKLTFKYILLKIIIIIFYFFFFFN